MYTRHTLIIRLSSPYHWLSQWAQTSQITNTRNVSTLWSLHQALAEAVN